MEDGSLHCLLLLFPSHRSDQVRLVRFRSFRSVSFCKERPTWLLVRTLPVGIGAPDDLVHVSVLVLRDLGPVCIHEDLSNRQRPELLFWLDVTTVITLEGVLDLRYVGSRLIGERPLSCR